MSKNARYPVLKFVQDYWSFLSGYRIKLSVLLLLIYLAGSLVYPITYLLGSIVDFFINYNSGESMRPFYILVASIAGLTCCSSMVRQNAKLAFLAIIAEIRKRIRLLAMSKMIDLEMKWHENENTGSKIHKIQSGSNKFFDIGRILANEGNDIIVGIGGALAAFIFLDWQYGVFAIVFLAIFFCIHIYFIRKKSRIQEEMEDVSEKLSGKVHESASNILAVKSLGLKRSMNTSLEYHESQYYQKWLEMGNLDTIRSQVFSIYAAVGYALFLLLLGIDAAQGIIQATTIFVFAAYFDRLKKATDIIVNVNNRFVEGKTGVGRLMSILGRKTVEREASHLKEVSLQWKQITFENVGFKYKDKWALRNFNMTIKRGDKIGIVGRSGSGKSTLAKLLLGLYVPQEGKIAIDGIDLHDYKQSTISSQMSIVLQDSEMFNSSLAENISIVDETVNSRMLNSVIKIAEMGSILKKLPAGLKTLIGEKGYKLSGGERQRVGIARALYADTSMLILDEATSHLDSKTEAQIQLNLQKNLGNKTLVVIAHRLSTLREVDRIVVMQAGRIIEEGSFDKLINKRGLFYELHKTQKSH